MLGLLADANLEGHFERLKTLIEEDELLRDVLAVTGCRFATLHELSWDRAIADDVLWRRCQAEGWVLVTANRNHAGPTSLEATIRREATPASLPVITIADARRLLGSRDYAVRVAYRLAEIVVDVGGMLGIGRIFVP